MDEDRKRFPDDEEYHFTESDSTEEFEPIEDNLYEQHSEKPKNKLRQMVILLVGVFLAILAIYQIYGFFSPSKQIPEFKMSKNIAEQPPKPNVVPPVTPAPMPQTVQQQVTPPPQQQPEQHSVASAPSEPITVPSHKLSTLETNLEASRSEANKLSANIAEMQQTMAKIEQKINDLGYNIKRMNDAIGAQARQIEEVRVFAMPKPVEKRVIARYIKRRMYFVQAIIPGRAWLRSNDGHTITVGEGSHIPGFGRVTLIDPPEGEVKLSTGMVLKYGPEEQ